MGLSRSTLKKFAKITNDRSAKTNVNTYVYATAVVSEDGTKYVKMDGSNQVTPVSRLTDIDDGDRVMVSIQDHKATVIGNLTYPPSARTANTALATAYQSAMEVETLKATVITTDTLYAETAKIGYLTADEANIAYAKITELDAVKANIEELEAKSITTEYLEAEYAKISQLDATNANIENLVARDAEIENLVADKATIEQLNATNAEITSLKAKDAEIENLFADYAKIESLEAVYAKIGTLEADYASIDYLKANYTTTGELNAGYAKIDFSNINTANIDKASVGELFAEMGLIDSAVIEEGHVTGYLQSVSINANSITAGTLSVERLVINGSEESIIFALNNAGELTSTSVDTLDGGLLTERTVTADKIVAHSITASELTVADIIGSSGWINLAQGTFNYGNQISWDGETLFISADAITMAAGDYFATKGEVGDVEVGARNLIRNSETLIFEEYYFEACSMTITDDGDGNVTIETPIIAASEDGNGNVTLMSYVVTIVTDEDGNTTLQPITNDLTSESSEMKTLTMGGVTYEVVDDKVRSYVSCRNERVTAYADKWLLSADGTYYYQAVDVADSTTYTRVDLQPTPEQIVSLLDESVTMFAGNDSGTIKLYAIGGTPSVDTTFVISVSEVLYK